VLIIIGVALGVLFFVALSFLLPILSGRGTQIIGVTGRYTVSTLPHQILNRISDGLTKLDTDGSVTTGLATSWETPDKGKTWIFKLNPEIVWQDGKKITSNTLNYQFSDVTTENPDAETIVFKLQNPYSAFPSVVSKPAFKKGLLGTGEWKVKNLSLAGSYVDQITLINQESKK
jgi:ABC-type transport system substrate-binding protein